MEKLKSLEPAIIGNGKELKAMGRGEAKIDTGGFSGILYHVSWVPGIHANLFSLSKAMD